MASNKFLTIVFVFLQGIVHQTDAVLEFTSTYTGSIAENTAAETEIIQLVATGGTDPVTYVITSKTPDLDWFEIVTDDKLRIKTGATVNYEDALLSGGSPITITVTATDAASGTAVQGFVLTITDVDEAPMFTLTSLTVRLASAPASTTLLTLAATDPESAAVTYGLIATSDAHVEISGADINVKTGVTLTDCVKVIAVKATDATSNEATDYGIACIGSCTVSCDGSGAGAITGNGLGILTALVVLMALYDRFH